MSELIKIIKKDLKNFVYKKILKYSDMKIEVERLKRTGMKIGKECYIFSSKIETAEPYLITLGNHVTIAPDVYFSTHDASANFYLENTSDIYGRITIGDYCFLGIGSIFLPGISLAPHTIVAAGAVVTKSIKESGWVIGGVPAKKICTIEDLKEKNIDKKLMTWGLTFEEKKKYLLKNEHLFKSV